MYIYIRFHSKGWCSSQSVLDTKEATAAKVRVLITSTDGVDQWSTVGVSTDIIEASLIALIDSIEVKLLRELEKKIKAFI